MMKNKYLLTERITLASLSRRNKSDLT